MHPPSRRPTLHDVARHAGVSHMTVSRVVRNSHAVAASTREKVDRAIAELGYRPDPALSALASYRTRGGGRGDGSVLAYLDCDGSAYSAIVREGVEAEARRLGYVVQSQRMLPAAAFQRRLARMLYHRGIRGLLFGPSDEPWVFQGWDWDRFAPVSLGALSHHPPMNAVAVDYFADAVQACDFLRASGCHRIGFAVVHSLESRTSHRWLGGYLAGIRTPPLLCPHPAGSNRELRRWAQTNQLDGLLTIHDHVRKAMEPLGLRVFFLNPFGCPSGVPCLRYDARRLGLEGVRLIHHQLLAHEFGLSPEIKTVNFPSTFTDPADPRPLTSRDWKHVDDTPGRDQPGRPEPATRRPVRAPRFRQRPSHI